MAIEKKQVYIVDDDESVCRSLKGLLMTFWFKVSTFNSAENFFSVVPDNVQGCLILDIHMPAMDGWEALKRIVGSGSKRPVIIMSTAKKEDLNDKALKKGAAGYLQKQFNGQA